MKSVHSPVLRSIQISIQSSDDKSLNIHTCRRVRTGCLRECKCGGWLHKIFVSKGTIGSLQFIVLFYREKLKDFPLK